MMGKDLVGIWACLQVVVVGVLGEAAVEEGPGEVVDGLLLGGDGACHDLGRHMVCQRVIQVALHGERLVQELLVVLLAWRVAHQHTPVTRECHKPFERRTEWKVKTKKIARCKSQQVFRPQLICVLSATLREPILLV